MNLLQKRLLLSANDFCLLLITLHIISRYYQNKFSEKYLPKEFFIEPLGLPEKPKLNEKPKDHYCL